MSDLVAAAMRLAPQFAARAAAHDVDGSYPAEDFADLRAAGLLGIMLPTALGGRGAGFGEYTAVAYDSRRGSGDTPLIFDVRAAFTGALAFLDEQLASALGVWDDALAARDRLLRAAAEGAWYAVAMSERGVCSRLSQLSTVYEPVAAGFRIRGAKSFVSGAGHADGYL